MIITREEAKQLLPILKAFAEGKNVQVFYENEWITLSEFNFNKSPNMYRIKPESEYRPFKTQEECWNEMLKHQPFGWTKLIEETGYSLITDVDNDLLYSDAFKECTFADGTPFGIQED